MPTYVYECTACSRQTELLQRVTDAPLRDCPTCGARVKKLLFAPGIVFKGSGFHINDYRKPEPKASEEPSSPESKTESKTEKKETAATSS